MRHLLLLCASLLVGCPEPPTVQNQGHTPGGGPPGTPPGEGEAAPPAEGGAAAEQSGGEAGAVQDRISPSAGRMDPMGFQVQSGAGVTLSGTVSYEGALDGVLRVDFLKNYPDQPLPELLHTVSLEEPGPFSVEAPMNLGQISVVAFVDTNENGPSEGEPIAHIEAIDVGERDFPGITLQLSDESTASEGGAPAQAMGMGASPTNGMNTVPASGQATQTPSAPPQEAEDTTASPGQETAGSDESG